MSVFVEANPPQILRAAEKDDSFIDYIRNEVAEIFQRLFGNQTWLQIQVLSDIGCIFLYYSLTTLVDSQTLGEEYVGLLQVDSTLRSLPNKLVRLLAISLQVLGPRIFSKFLARLEIWFRNPEHVPDLQPKARESILELIDVVKTGSFWFGRLNLIFFYMFGKYYRLSQRMTKINYVFTLDNADSGNYNSTFQLIGKIGLVHSTLLLISNLVSRWKNSEAKHDVANPVPFFSSFPIQQICNEELILFIFRVRLVTEELLKQYQQPSARSVGIKEKTQLVPLAVTYFAGCAFYSGCKPKKNALYVEKMYNLQELYHCSITNEYHHYHTRRKIKSIHFDRQFQTSIQQNSNVSLMKQRHGRCLRCKSFNQREAALPATLPTHRRPVDPSRKRNGFLQLSVYHPRVKGNFACESDVGWLKIGWAQDVTGRYLLVINTTRFPQIHRLEACRYAEKRCEYLPPCYKSSCKQRYTNTHLIVIDPAKPRDGPFIELFPLPSSCSCFVENFVYY